MDCHLLARESCNTWWRALKADHVCALAGFIPARAGGEGRGVSVCVGAGWAVS